MPADLDPRRIAHLAAAARCGSLTAAAAELGLTQPALSKSIRELERALGVPVLERGRFGATPTEYGEALIARGRAIEAELRAAGGSSSAADRRRRRGCCRWRSRRCTRATRGCG
jgi:molybdate transport repressor ModE-like protein